MATLAERGQEAKVLVGGQSLIPLTKLRFASTGTLIDINRIPGLGYIEATDGRLRIGALTRHNEVADSDVVRDANGTMAAAAPWIADPLVRNLGSIGGSSAHADPQGDWASVMLACGADIVARSAGGERVIPIGGFLVDMFQSALRPDELLTEIRVPRYAGRSGGAYLKLERKIGDHATVGVAVHLELDDTGERISVRGTGSRRWRPRTSRWWPHCDRRRHSGPLRRAGPSGCAGYRHRPPRPGRIGSAGRSGARLPAGARVADSDLARVRAPAGLDLGHVAHHEIAVAILAELVALRAAGGLAARGVAPAAEDPVSSMTVAVATCRYRSERGGVTGYFCGPKCYRQFETGATPSREQTSK